MMGKRIATLGVGLVVLMIVSMVAFVRLNPPLLWDGHTENPFDNTIKIIAVKNNGYADISIDQVLINGNEAAKKVEVGVWRWR